MFSFFFLWGSRATDVLLNLITRSEQSVNYNSLFLHPTQAWNVMEEGVWI